MHGVNKSEYLKLKFNDMNNGTSEVLLEITIL